jgi:hypothetical protein
MAEATMLAKELRQGPSHFCGMAKCLGGSTAFESSVAFN